MFNLYFKSKFFRKEKKLTKNSSILQSALGKTIDLLEENPNNPILKTHKTITKASKEKVFSSRVTGDIRIIWKFNKEKAGVIDILDIGGHEGGGRVYK